MTIHHNKTNDHFMSQLEQVKSILSLLLKIKVNKGNLVSICDALSYSSSSILIFNAFHACPMLTVEARKAMITLLIFLAAKVSLCTSSD